VVLLNRPKKMNAMNKLFWTEIRECFQQIATDKRCRVVVLGRAGRAFTSGLDVTDHASVFVSDSGGGDDEPDVARRSADLRRFVLSYQEAFTAVEKVPQPVIACVHSACVGGGIDLIACCDVRLCSQDAWFTIKEVDIGLAADVGTLQVCCV
jgi:delta(3,5)-delta(2,4)-dienoyl-CoA isomerase